MKFYSKGIIEKNKIMNLSLSSSSRSLEEKAEFFPSFHQTLRQGYRLLVEYGGCDNFELSRSDATAQLGPLMARPRILSRSFGFGPWAELIVYG